ncbi:uncharacterized protein LOC125229590 [Leguminivora glycinivorella]|uniref:uncharacterized protein LOC125229590 n=1 Tax=Leguminivora glycinivorella TaxID=1035111 RepID=UPI002010262E|nr:uncharacterized protein LOC125229590 [Leguminivora glycinivorella]
MADDEDSPYIVYVASKSEDNDNALEHNIANDAEVYYADEEYLEISQEEDENYSEGPNQSLNDVDMLDYPGSSISTKQEARSVCSTIQPAVFRWTHQATLHLIEAYQSFETPLVSGEMNISQVWDQVAKNLQTQGDPVTPQQCKNKFGSLKQIYEKMKEQECNSGVSVKRWIYMDLVEPIMKEMEKYRSYSNDAWDSPKCKDINQLNINTDDHERIMPDGKQTLQNIYKWENADILSLIDLYRKYQGALDSGSISQKVLFRLVEKDMQNKGFNVTATQCMVKIHSLKKTYRSIKEYNQVNRLIPRRWKYYDLIDSIIHGMPDTNYDPLEEVSETLAEIKSEEATPTHIFKWRRRSIEILVNAYREHRPPLHDTKATRQKVWQIVVQKLRKEGYDVSVAQCRSKISGMLKLFRRNKSGAGGRAWKRGGWYSKLIESLVDNPKREAPKRLSETRRAESVLEQLIICEENRERRHRENMEQRQQLIDIMGQLLERLS